MIWIFERQGEIVRFETRFDNDTREYVLVVFWFGGSQTVETYRQVCDFSERLSVLEQQLVTEGWSQIDNPQIRYRTHGPRSTGMTGRDEWRNSRP